MMEDSTKLRLAFKLSRQQVSLMQLLMSMDVVPLELITDRLGFATESRVAMHRLRKTLLKHDIIIESKRGFGYWISSETKARIRHRVSDVTVNGNKRGPDD